MDSRDELFIRGEDEDEGAGSFMPAMSMDSSDELVLKGEGESDENGAADSESGEMNSRIKQLKDMSRGKGDVSSAKTKSGFDIHVDNSKQPQNLDEFIELVDSFIVKTRRFRTGKVDNLGRVVGIYEYSSGVYPHARQDHHYDEHDRVIKFEKYENDFTKPVTRFYFYESMANKISESVWLDRYGKIANIHRYKYDSKTGLMTDRAEYNREGEIFYQIHSEYDMNFAPPRLVEDIWKDKAGNLIQRYVYEYDDEGEVVVEHRYNSQNHLLGSFHFTYDDRRVNLIRKEWRGPEGDLRSYFLYENNADNYTTRVELFDGSDNKESSQTFTYDEIGNLKEEVWYDRNDVEIKRLKY